MLDKDRRRAERRHRSYCTWMRRLKRDWAEHVGPWSPKLTWENGVCSFSPGDRTERCACYNLEHPQALRFKDTPNQCACWTCANPRKAFRGKRKLELTFQELREFQKEEVSFGKKKHRPEHLALIRKTCICGFLFETKLMPSGQISWGERRPHKRCVSCTKRFGPEQKIMPA